MLFAEHNNPNLLSDDIRIVASFDLKTAVIRPKINWVGNASDASFVDLQ